MTFWNVKFFSIGKKLYESILIIAKIWLILFAIPLLLFIRYLVLSQNLSHHSSNNTKYLILLWILINPSTLSNVTDYGFAPAEVLYKMS